MFAKKKKYEIDMLSIDNILLLTQYLWSLLPFIKKNKTVICYNKIAIKYFNLTYIELVTVEKCDQLFFCNKIIYL